MSLILFSKRIVCNPKILKGKPVIKGTRISVEFILELLHSGMSLQNILDEYTQLSKVDLEAALAFAKHAVSHEEVIPLFELVPSLRA
ncbi:MAG: DUF433 domain-containing protein [bacterium]|nr:DUF433 domain-containing protein [bacterium]